jgi:hypothetical protein
MSRFSPAALRRTLLSTFLSLVAITGLAVVSVAPASAAPATQTAAAPASVSLARTWIYGYYELYGVCLTVGDTGIRGGWWTNYVCFATWDGSKILYALQVTKNG